LRLILTRAVAQRFHEEDQDHHQQQQEEEEEEEQQQQQQRQEEEEEEEEKEEKQQQQPSLWDLFPNRKGMVQDDRSHPFTELLGGLTEVRSGFEVSAYPCRPMMMGWCRENEEKINTHITQHTVHIILLNYAWYLICVRQHFSRQR
jgi:hypothetical protein